MNERSKRYAPVVTIVIAAVILLAAPLVDPPRPGSEPILTMAALFVFGVVLFPVAALLSVLDRAPRFRWSMGSFAVLVAVPLVAGG